MVEALKNSQHERLILLGQKIEEFKSSLREFEKRLEEEYSLEDLNNLDEDEESLVEQRLRQHTQPFPNSGGLYVKRDYLKGKGYIVKSVHITNSLINMVGWDINDFMMECALTRQHVEYLKLNVKLFLFQKLAILQCVLKFQKLFLFQMETLQQQIIKNTIIHIHLQLIKKPKQKKFTFSEKQFIESFYSQLKDDDSDGEDNINRICKYRVLSQNRVLKF